MTSWTLLGHLVMPFVGGMGSFLKQVVRARGSINRASERVAADLAHRPVNELTAFCALTLTNAERPPESGRAKRWPWR